MSDWVAADCSKPHNLSGVTETSMHANLDDVENTMAIAEVEERA